jgi:hypothetical protein
MRNSFLSVVLVVDCPQMRNFIGAVQLSVWDNISGPKVQYLWLGVEAPSEELQMTVARHSLAGDMAPPDREKIETTFQVFSKFGKFDELARISEHVFDLVGTPLTLLCCVHV